MQKRQIATTDIHVSPLGLGTVKFGRNQGIKYPQGFELPTDKEMTYLLDLAKDLGINLLDTAPAYGLAEQRLGKLLRHRSEWVIETKVGENFIEGQSSFDFSAVGTRRSIEKSLRLLKTDYLDMVLIHSNGDDTRILQQEATLETLLKMRDEGWLRAVGISSKTTQGGLLAFEKECDVVMATYNPLYTKEQPILQTAHQLQRAVFIKKAFASGHLNKIAINNPIETALQFIFSQMGVTSIILGTINPIHLQQNVFITQQILSNIAY